MTNTQGKGEYSTWSEDTRIRTVHPLRVYTRVSSGTLSFLTVFRRGTHGTMRLSFERLHPNHHIAHPRSKGRELGACEKTDPPGNGLGLPSDERGQDRDDL